MAENESLSGDGSGNTTVSSHARLPFSGEAELKSVLSRGLARGSTKLRRVEHVIKSIFVDSV